MSQAETRTQDGALETPLDAGKGQEGVVARWMQEIKLADTLEKNWRKDVDRAKDVYRNKNKKANQFNILWANIEVLRPNLYNSTPKPDCRRRFRDEDPIGKQVAEVLERGLSFEVDTCDFDEVMSGVVFDDVLPGRGIARVRFEPSYEEVPDESGNMVKTLTAAKTYPELVHWKRFRRAPGAVWEDVSWIAYEHAMTKREVEEVKVGASLLVNYDYTIDGVDKEKADIEPTVFKRVCVWEIWDKETRKVLWIAPSYEDAPLLEEDDKLKLQGFFDIPRPLYAIDDTTTLVPIVEYTQYEEQAKELNIITARITNLTKALKVRGLYDATITEMASLIKGDDNDLVPVTNATMAMAAGGLDKAIWMMPIEQIAKVLAQLHIQREQVKMVIYEVVGLSDIMRGQSNPNETLGAQELKTNNASVRLQRRQREVQRFARDIMRIMAEIIAENYTPEFLTMMTGIQVTPEMMAVLKRDLIRGIHVDIETDSTIAADQSRDRKDVAEIMEAVGAFGQNFAPMVQSGAISMDAAKQILMAVIRRARMGREVEDALEADAARQKQQEEEQKRNPQPPQPTPEQMKIQADMQSSQAQIQQKTQESQAMIQIKTQESQANQQAKQMELEGKAQQAIAQHQLDLQKLEFDKQTQLQELEIEKSKAAEEIRIKREEYQLLREKTAYEMDLEYQKFKAQLEIDNKKMQADEKRATHEQTMAVASQKVEKAAKEQETSQEPNETQGDDGAGWNEIASAIRDVGVAFANKPVSKQIDIQTDKDGNIKGGTVSG